MKNYYHMCPTCPCCHEPNLSGSILRIVDEEKGILKCSLCKAYFHEKVDFKDFKRTWKFMADGNSKYDSNVNKIPLLWNITPNIIEAAYLGWLNGDTFGKYLITWPWKQVKFIPLLISNLAIEYPENKIVIISSLNNTSYYNSDEIIKPDLYTVFDNLFYCDNLVELTEDFLNEARKFNRKNVLEKRKKISYHIKIVKPLNSSEFDLEVDNSVDAENCSYRKCKNKIKKKLEQEYGNNSVKLFKWKEGSIWKKTSPDRINNGGYFEISLDQRLEWGGDIKYDRISYWKALTNIKKLFRVNYKIESIKISDDNFNDQNIENNQVFFIPDLMDPNQIFRLIKSINPELIIFDSADNFIEDKIVFNGSKGKEFVNFLSETEKTVLMFSVKPDSRHLYKIGLDDGFTEKYDIITHTWDSTAVLEKIVNKVDNNKFKSPASSCFSEIKDNPKITAEYIHLNCLDIVEEVTPKIIQIMDGNYQIKKFFDDLIKTPLYINDHNIQKNFRRGDWNFENIMGHIWDTDPNAFQEVIKPFNEYYLRDGDPFNPIMNKIIKLSTDIIKIENSVALIIVNYYDRKGTEQILIEEGLQDYIPDKLRVCTWNELNDLNFSFESNIEFHVISTTYPYITYQLNDSLIKNYIFIGSNKNLEKTKIILENRLNEKNTHPIHIPSSEKEMPKLLETTLNELQSVEKINSVLSELEIEENMSLSGSKKPVQHAENSKTHQMKIGIGEEVVIAVDDNKNGIFLPLNRHVSFINKNKDSIEEIEIKKSKINDLLDKEIIIDNQGFYASYKLIFTEFMIEIGDNTIFKTLLYNWHGFKDLINNSTEWLILLKKAIKSLQKDKILSENEAKDELANILVNLDINASNPDYIKNFWFSEPSTIKTSQGSVHVFEIEHPRSFEDLVVIYKKLNDIIPNINPGDEDPIKCYTAAITLQNIRRNFYHGKNIPHEYKHFYNKLQEEIRIIIQNSKKFKVKSVTTVKLNKKISPFKILDDYMEYYQ